MVNSGVLPEHRGRGLYTELMSHALEILKAKGDFNEFGVVII